MKCGALHLHTRSSLRSWMTSVHDGGSSFQGVGAIASQAWPKAYLLRRSVEYAFVDRRTAFLVVNDGDGFRG